MRPTFSEMFLIILNPILEELLHFTVTLVTQYVLSAQRNRAATTILCQYIKL